MRVSSLAILLNGSCLVYAGESSPFQRYDNNLNLATIMLFMAMVIQPGA